MANSQWPIASSRLPDRRRQSASLHRRLHAMTQPEQSKTRFWLPLTPRGVAAFARASWWRLLLVQFIFATLVAAAVVWFLDTAWFPTIHNAIRKLPARGEI